MTDYSLLLINFKVAYNINEVINTLFLNGLDFNVESCQHMAVIKISAVFNHFKVTYKIKSITHYQNGISND